MRRCLYALSLFLLLSPLCVQAQQLHVTRADSPDLVLELAEIQHLSAALPSDTLRIQMHDGTLHSLPIADIQRISFSNLTGLTEREAHVARSFALIRSYPNPFNASTTIAYDLPHAGQVSVVVVNITGQVVRHLINKREHAGTHEVVWDGTSDTGVRVASGMYLCHVQLADQHLVTRLTHLK